MIRWGDVKGVVGGLFGKELIPDAARAMMRDRLQPAYLPLFHRIVEEEVDENSIDVSVRMLLHNLVSDQLDTPYAASAELDLPRMAAFDRSELPNVAV